MVRGGLDLWANHRITVEVARLEAQYGSLAESTPGVPPVSESDNRARAVRAAAALTAFAPSQKLSEVRRALGLLVKLPASTPVPDDLRAFVEANRDAICLAVFASLRQEPILIAQLIRAAIGIQHFEAVQRLVTQAEPSKASLKELARRLVESRTPELVHTGLLGELKRFNAAFRLCARPGTSVSSLAESALEWNVPK